MKQRYDNPVLGRLETFGWREFMGVGLLALGIFGALGIEALYTWSPPFPLAALKLQIACTNVERSLPQAFQLYGAHAHWVGMLALFIVTAAFTSCLSFVAMAAVARDCKSAGRGFRCVGFWALPVLGAAALVYHAFRRGPGLLSHFLETLAPDTACAPVSDRIDRLRQGGEAIGFIMGMAMTSLVVFASKPTTHLVVTRLQWLQRLIYCVSLLFVVGVLMSRANFSWVVANWIGEASDETGTKAVSDMVTGGLLQASVGYSALIALFFLPVRVCLAWFADSLVPEQHAQSYGERVKWLEEHHLRTSWREDTKQILALLAPLVSAPLFDAILKT